jgi:hypothetical protein
LKTLCFSEGIIKKQGDDIEIEEQVVEIEIYVNVLNEMETLIVIFDAIEHSDNLDDAIANAMLKGINYRVENWEQFFSPEIRTAELVWCLVKLYSRSIENTIYYVDR